MLRRLTRRRRRRWSTRRGWFRRPIRRGEAGNPAAALAYSECMRVSVPLHPSVTIGVIALAVILAVAGGLLAGSFGSWRIARLRPADALTRVA
jgi:putative ABC transport system permease protein